MWNAGIWREKARLFRERAASTRDAERERVFQHLAEDCEEMADRLEHGRDPSKRWDGAALDDGPPRQILGYKP